jgi:hypothetical protein
MTKTLDSQRNNYYLASFRLSGKLKADKTFMTKLLDSQRNDYFLASVRLSGKLKTDEKQRYSPKA